MRIRPFIVTTVAVVVSSVAVLAIVMVTEPSEAQPNLILLLWAALFLTSWGLLCTLLLLARQTIAQAIWVSLPPAIAVIGVLMALQRGWLSRQISGGVILSAVVLSSVIWWKLRRTKKPSERASLYI